MLSKLKVNETIDVELNLEDIDISASESKVAYTQIIEYVLETYGLKVSSLYIAQTKRKLGLEVREAYNKSNKDDNKVPQCSKEKEDAIIAALKHFKMI